ncbi:hypothetical protein FKM82_018619 [Ascaphus truei]
MLPTHLILGNHYPLVAESVQCINLLKGYFPRSIRGFQDGLFTPHFTTSKPTQIGGFSFSFRLRESSSATSRSDIGDIPASAQVRATCAEVGGVLTGAPPQFYFGDDGLSHGCRSAGGGHVEDDPEGLRNLFDQRRTFWRTPT